MPTVLIATPYVKQDVERYPSRNLAQRHPVVHRRGYASPSTTSAAPASRAAAWSRPPPAQIDDVARVIEYLGRDAPWTSGAVGMYGHSYDAETQVSTAGLGDPERI